MRLDKIPMRLEDPVAMCNSVYGETMYWVRGHVDKTKFKGALLGASLEGDEDAHDIFAGRVQHGWVITVAGDWSGCGGDYTLEFVTEEPPEVGAVWRDIDDPEFQSEPNDGKIVDKQLATWWEPKR